MSIVRNWKCYFLAQMSKFIRSNFHWEFFVFYQFFFNSFFPKISKNALVQIFVTPLCHCHGAIPHLLIESPQRNTKWICDVCSKLTIKTPEQCQWYCSGVSILNFEHISHLSWCFHCWIWTSKCRLGSLLYFFCRIAKFFRNVFGPSIL